MLLPNGFRFSGVACGIKASRRMDVAVIAGAAGTVAAGVYTQNQIVAAPVIVSRQRTPGQIRALVINSGNANACTGEQGMRDAVQMTEITAQAIGCKPEEVLVMSTGIIGRPLPMAKVAEGIKRACGFLDSGEIAFHNTADAMMTTDNARKTALKRFFLPSGRECRIAGLAKGAGMIGPNMATLLGVVVTDYPLDSQQADQLLREIADRSFNSISVEGHMSTNDSLVLMSSGHSKQPLPGEADFAVFAAELEALFIDLAKKIPIDGEGATHLIEINISGAESDSSAKVIAQTIADSPLVKTAITGGDPNWGRIVSAAGYAGEKLQPELISLKIQGFLVYENGTPARFDAAVVNQAMTDNLEVRLELNVGSGPGKTRFWTSDLTAHYVNFNSHYTT